MTKHLFDKFEVDEETSLLLGSQFANTAGSIGKNNGSSSSSRSEDSSGWIYKSDPSVPIGRIRRLADFLGGLVVASAAFMIFHPSGKSNENTFTKSVIQPSVQESVLRYSITPPSRHAAGHHNDHDVHSDHDHTRPLQKHDFESKYKKFQALGFQIYTGGAPVVLRSDDEKDNSNGDVGTVTEYYHNPECAGLNSYGKADDFDQDDIELNLTDVFLWECYLGESNPKKDVHRRLQIMTDAVAKAEEVSDKDSDVLKVFVAPEFFWRGKDGAYVFYNESDSSTRWDHYFNQGDTDDHCTEICHILKGLEELVANPKYKDWVFLFGTVIVSEVLPKEDDFDYLFYNFAPAFRGYDPEETDHYGKRFLVPKRYVSNIDFLSPARQFDEQSTKELYGIIRGRDATVQVEEEDGPHHQESTTVHNPFQMRGHKYYDRDMWHRYKQELEDLGYTMLEYDWLILDNITFTIEVCLDHDVHTALNAYLADKVLGSPTLIPKNGESYDHDLKRQTGWIEYVGIPRHQAQLSLVSSSGMTINPDSMVLTNNGTIILQDGLSSKEGNMSFTKDECDRFGWHFSGGSEHISRTANLTSTEISFQYHIHSGRSQVGIWDELEDLEDTSWKKAIRGVFTTERYEPKITVYTTKEIAQVSGGRF